MTLFSLPFRSHKVRVSVLPASDFHSLGHDFGGPLRPPVRFPDRPEELNRPNSSQLWFAKVVYTLYVLSYHCFDSVEGFLSQRVTPLIAYGAVGRIKDPALAFGLFELSREKLNLKHGVCTYDYLLRMFCQSGHLELADSVLGCMRSDGYFPSNQLMGILVSSLVESGRLDSVRALLAQADSGMVDVDVFLYNKALNVLIRQNRVEEALVFFKDFMCSRGNYRVDTCTFNILIRGLCRIGKVDEAFSFFYDMDSFGCMPDIITYNTLIDGLCKANDVRRGHDMLKEIQGRDDILPDVKTFTAVISGYCKKGMMDEATALFDEMTMAGVRPTLVTYNVLIDGFGKLGNMASALAIHEKMLFVGCSPDVVTFSSLIDGYCRTGHVDKGLKLLGEMIARKLSPNEYTFAIIINALCKQNRLVEARDFLVQLKWRNVVPQPFMYNPVIDGLCRSGNLEEAKSVVAEMEERCKPDKITYTVLIIGHCMKGRMLEALNLYNRMFVVKCTPDTLTVNCLVSCLLKAGMAREAMQIMKQVAAQSVKITTSPSCESVPSNTTMGIPTAA